MTAAEDAKKKKEELLKNLAKGYLKKKGTKEALSCCPTSVQKQSGEEVECPCGPNDGHHHHHNHDQQQKDGNNNDPPPPMPESRVPTFNILLLGDSGVGKTSFLKKHLMGTFVEGDHTETMEIMAGSMLFLTNFGVMQFNVWDTPSNVQHSCEVLIDTHLTENEIKNQIHGAIIMFNVMNRLSYEHAIRPENWGNVNRILNDKRSHKRDIPIVFVGNKADADSEQYRKVKKLKIKQEGQSYCDISIKDTTDIEKPFLSLARTLTGLSNLNFVRPDENERKEQREARQKRRAKGKLKKNRRK